MKMYDAMSIAGYIVKKSIEIEHPVDNLKLQKLLYYVQGESYKINDKPLFRDEIHAYLYGPAVKEVYEDYRRNVGADIYYIENEDMLEDIDVKSQLLIDSIIDRYKEVTSWSLYEKVRDEEPFKDAIRYDIIPKDVIRKYFRDLDFTMYF